ncbi:hypothetical protein GPECTOR_1298g544 [Gonium pectorale]|uniref:Uncharacterized protein n=1 Tax=Gonium pectorale TaxID=33097 RepID=A0A150FTI8_GONPE|nr:hypothetical protein GPECTOR_1298g544 [Gonium pectorale]|eukprot:KXZ40922.1 hypothetical protein GPECTOR_1298g544 [Gonium pectorale]
MDYRQRMESRGFTLLEPQDTPQNARLDAVFSLPPELWPVLPPGALYCLETHDPRVGFSYLQHADFPENKVRVSTYFGKWCRDKVDFVVAWLPPRAAMGSAASEGHGPPPPAQAWEPRQVLGHTTSGEYQYSRTRFRFRGATSALTPEQLPLEYCDVHGIDHLDTKVGWGVREAGDGGWGNEVRGW